MKKLLNNIKNFIKDYWIFFIALVFIFSLALIPIVYWFSNDTLTGIQVFKKFWYCYVLLWIISLFSKRKK